MEDSNVVPVRQRRPPKETAVARGEILAAAAHLFTQRGYHATSVREMADYLGMSQSSLYYHARSKPQILVDIHEEFMSELVATFQAIETSDASPLQKIRAAITELLQAIADNPDVVAVVLHERRSLPPDVAALIQSKRDEVDAAIDGFLVAGIADGSLRKVNVRVARLAIAGMTNWAYTWFRADGELTADELADQFFDMLVHGLTPSSKRFSTRPAGRHAQD